MKLSSFVFVFSTLVLAVAALPVQDAAETTVASVGDANDALPTEVPSVARQEEGPTEVPAEEDEEDEEDSPNEGATTLRTAPDLPAAPVPPKAKLPSSSFVKEWAIVTGDVAPSDIANKRENQPEKETITSS